jgi:hypothetical protein
LPDIVYPKSWIKFKIGFVILLCKESKSAVITVCFFAAWRISVYFSPKIWESATNFSEIAPSESASVDNNLLNCVLISDFPILNI